ncbi:MAG TPA: hypothetical protein VF510_01445 [Ktedonobacterales bacterium]
MLKERRVTWCDVAAWLLLPALVIAVFLQTILHSGARSLIGSLATEPAYQRIYTYGYPVGSPASVRPTLWEE